jgi:hypothetical protein
MASAVMKVASVSEAYQMLFWSGVVVAQNLKEQQGSERERTKRVKFTKRSLVKWSPLNDEEESLVCIFFFKKKSSVDKDTSNLH